MHLTITDNQELSFIHPHQIPRMLMHQNIFLLGVGDVGVDFCCADGAVSQHLLDVADIHILLQQECGKGMAKHVGRDVLAEAGKAGIAADHKADGLV